MRKIVCDAGCNQEFTTEAVSELIRDDIERVYFKCPHCGHEYTCFYTNDKIKHLQKIQRKLLSRTDPEKSTPRKIRKTLQEIESNKNLIKCEMVRLKVSIQGDQP